MYRKTFLMLLGVLMVLPAFAHSFAYEYEGQALTYDVLDEEAKEVKVIRSDDIFGDLVIPAIAKDGEIEYSVTSIGSCAFQGYDGLTTVTIPNSVTSIGDYAFDRCRSLTFVTIPNSLTFIGMAAFCGCSALTSSVTIPKSVISIGVGAFAGCTGMGEILVDQSNQNYCSIGGVLFNKDATEIITFPGGKTGEYIIPKSVMTIGESAFENCYSLTSVTIPDSVTIISNQAFDECYNLSTIIFSGNVGCLSSFPKGANYFVPSSKIKKYKAAYPDYTFTAYY